ncbi:exported hypothetical protein [uncultured Desulfobacterium sp.]|uniref:Uncharacterized protein n=1 Tax=uncultured Desulfobacterium sp. TaxID=201089 RepID=A0A445MVX8_9BACT|nr:exported hypothetical protein [uncultured Desulfobacterium sp.]
MTRLEILPCLALLLGAYSISFAGDPDTGYGTIIAVEFKVDNKSYKPPIGGHFEYTGTSLDIVSIFEGIAGIGVLTQAQVYIVVEKEIVARGLHQLKAKNQYGTIVSGTLDFRDQPAQTQSHVGYRRWCGHYEHIQRRQGVAKEKHSNDCFGAIGPYN